MKWGKGSSASLSLENALVALTSPSTSLRASYPEFVPALVFSLVDSFVVANLTRFSADVRRGVVRGSFGDQLALAEASISFFELFVVRE